MDGWGIGRSALPLQTGRADGGWDVQLWLTFLKQSWPAHHIFGNELGTRPIMVIGVCTGAAGKQEELSDSSRVE